MFLKHWRTCKWQRRGQKAWRTWPHPSPVRWSSKGRCTRRTSVLLMSRCWLQPQTEQAEGKQDENKCIREVLGFNMWFSGSCLNDHKLCGVAKYNFPMASSKVLRSDEKPFKTLAMRDTPSRPSARVYKLDPRLQYMTKYVLRNTDYITLLTTFIVLLPKVRLLLRENSKKSFPIEMRICQQPSTSTYYICLEHI